MLAAVAGIEFGINDAIIIAVAIIVGTFTLIRGRSDIWRNNYDAERARNDLLVGQVERLTRDLAKATSQLEALKAQPDLSTVMTMTRTMLDALQKHEDKELEVWQTVNTRLDNLKKSLEFNTGELEDGVR